MAQEIIKYFSSDTLTIDNLIVEFTSNAGPNSDDPQALSNKIEGVTVSNISSTQATINWSTLRPTIYQIKFQGGVCPPDGCTIINNTFAIEHSKKITGLQANTDYIFIIIGITDGGFIFQSAPLKFKTGKLVNIEVPVTQPPAPTILSGLNSSYKWNIENKQTFSFEIQTSEDAEYIKYYFKNQPENTTEGFIKTPVINGIVKFDLVNPNELGIFELAVVPGNSVVGDGIEYRSQINIIKEIFYGEPDITKFDYPKIIKEADLKPQEFTININADVVNSEGVFIQIGSETGDRILDLPVQNNKISVSLYGKTLLQTFKNNITETSDKYFFTFYFQPYFNGFQNRILGRKESITIEVEKTKYIISLDEAIEKLASPFEKLFNGTDTKKDYSDKIIFEDDKHLYYRVRYQSDVTQDSYVITNTAADIITYSNESGKIVRTEFEIDQETGDTIRVQKTPYPTLVVKLLEPLPAEIDVNSLVWISKQIIPTVVEDILITEQDEDDCRILQPNFNIDVSEESGYEWFSQLVASGSSTSTNIVNQYLSSSGFDLTKLNISYTSGSDITSNVFIRFEEFVNFSSAEARVNNFEYKLDAIDFYKQKISSSLYSGTTLSTSSYSLITSQSYNKLVSEIQNGFDGFEKTLYEDYNITSSNSPFFGYQIDNAISFDNQNKNYLVRNLPVYLVESEDSSDFVLFMKMIGQHFDILWSYIKSINKNKRITNTALNGINDELVYHLLENLGWDPGTPFSAVELWREAFGTQNNGNPYPNSNQLQNSISSEFTIKEARNQVWRRLLNNLPYLLKHKGTKRAINAIMSCYGVPSSLLTIMEFGGPGVQPSDTTQYTYDDRTAALKISETENITIPWISSSAYVPTSVQIRFKTKYKIPTSTSATGSQLIRKDRTGGGYWQVNVVPTFTSSFGNVVFTMKDAAGTTTTSLQISQSVLFDDYWKNVTVQKERFVSASTNYDRFTLYVKEGLDDRIIMNQSTSSVILASSFTNIFTDTGTLYINASGATKGISGSIDEVRIWNSALSESVVSAHALNPDVIYGNGIYSSTDNLLVRLDFEYVKNRIADPYIKNVSPSVTFSGSTAIGGYIGYATASISTIATSYPYQYDVYERTVSATIPSIGFVPNDKIRFEEIDLISDLSHLSRSTQKSFDRSSIDSNRLGLFFSPVKELNMDILKSLGPINIGDYIGDWQQEYGTDKYKDLNTLRNYYFKRTNLNFEEYIKLVKSIDKSLFKMLEQVIPARASVTKGLLIEPSVLERSKIKINKPVFEKIYESASLSVKDTTNIEINLNDLNGILKTQENTKLTGSLAFYEGKIDENSDIYLDVIYDSNESKISVQNNINIETELLVSAESDMGGIVAEIDAERTSTIIGEYELESGYEQVGMDIESPFNLGFGLVGNDGFVDRTYIRNDGTVVLTERKNAYVLIVRYSRDVPNTNTSNITTYEKIYKYKKKLILVDSEITTAGATTVKSATAHSFYSNIITSLGTYPYDNGVITEIYPFNGLTSGHYKFVKDTTRGLENSFYRGSKQTSITTIDKSSAVETFITNPNRLKVNDSGRGSGEPILEVD
jgi:hypothetical protein